MSKFKSFILRNKMLSSNFIANLIGVVIVKIVSYQSVVPPTPEIKNLAQRIDHIFIPFAFILVVVFAVFYEWPFRRYLKMISKGYQPPGELLIVSRRRLLNEPFILISLNFAVWLAGAIIYPSVFYLTYPGHVVPGRAFLQSLTVGLITVIIAFFLLEHILQRRLVPVFFPRGGLSVTPGTFRIRIRTRLAVLVLACNIIPCVVFLLIIRGTYQSGADPAQLLNLVRTSIHTNSTLFIVMGIFLTMLVSFNLTKPFEEIVRVLKGVRNGSFDKKVKVTSNDEIGYTGDVINEMTEGLKERVRMRQSLDLAREVQLNLLPKASPSMRGLDIAGKSIYCDQTGGDYFDYLEYDDLDRGKIGLVVGDVSGHGISSALLMATARAFLRLRSFMPGSIAQAVTDVNRQLARDLGSSGDFMTLFYLGIDPGKRILRWVRAGHDPAILYDPDKDTFEPLKGTGVALGVEESWQYEENEKSGLVDGQIIVIGTDGIWEARNKRGELFGKDPIYKIIRKNPRAGAGEILDEIIETLNHFQKENEFEDDVTIVVVKVSRE